MRSRARHRILLVDPHPLVRAALGALLARTRDLRVCGAAATPAEALVLAARRRPHLVVTDLPPPGTSDAQRVAQLCATRPVLVLSLDNEVWHAAHAFQAGAAGFVAKGEGPELLRAIRRLLRGAVHASPRLRGGVLRQFARPAAAAPLATLTRLERRVFAASARGAPDRALAPALGVSPAQLARCRAALRAKLHLANDAAVRHHAQLWRAARHAHAA